MNAYAIGVHEEDTLEYAARDPAYAVEENTPHGYTHGTGWTNPAVQPGTPNEPIIDFAVDGDEPPQSFFARLRGKEKLLRHAVEDLDADGWTVRSEGSGRPTAIDPRRTPPAATRPTQRMGPLAYSFTRPFDQHAARRLNGVRFSLAEYRRDYEILGMNPPRRLRNTYRLEPTPWDTDVVDMPPDVEPTYGLGNARITAVDVPPQPNRAWRL